EWAFHRVFTVEDRRQAADVVVGKFLGPALGIHLGLFANAQSQRRSDAVDVPQRNVRRLVGGKVNTQNTRHFYLLTSSLALLVAGIGADYEQTPLAADHFAVLAY